MPAWGGAHQPGSSLFPLRDLPSARNRGDWPAGDLRALLAAVSAVLSKTHSLGLAEMMQALTLFLWSGIMVKGLLSWGRNGWRIMQFPLKSVILLKAIEWIVATIYLISTLHQAFRYLVFFAPLKMMGCGCYYSSMSTPRLRDYITHPKRCDQHMTKSAVRPFPLCYALLFGLCWTHLLLFSKMFHSLKFLHRTETNHYVFGCWRHWRGSLCKLYCTSGETEVENLTWSHWPRLWSWGHGVEYDFRVEKTLYLFKKFLIFYCYSITAVCLFPPENIVPLWWPSYCLVWLGTGSFPSQRYCLPSEFIFLY